MHKRLNELYALSMNLESSRSILFNSRLERSMKLKVYKFSRPLDEVGSEPALRVLSDLKFRINVRLILLFLISKGLRNVRWKSLMSSQNFCKVICLILMINSRYERFSNNAIRSLCVSAGIDYNKINVPPC